MSKVTPHPVDFGAALDYLKHGYRLARKGWNAANQWIALNPGSSIVVSEGRPLAAVFPVGTPLEIKPYLIIKTVQGSIVPWLASQTDLLAEDWFVVD